MSEGKTEIQVRTVRDYRYRSSACVAGSHDGLTVGPPLSPFLERQGKHWGPGKRKKTRVIALSVCRMLASLYSTDLYQS